MIILYGLKNCDTCRKATKWAEAEGIPYTFTDFKKDGLDPAKLESWINAVGWETLLNKRSTTWRGLSDDEKQNPTSETAKALMRKHPTLIKRPVIESDTGVSVGFTGAL